MGDCLFVSLEKNAKIIKKGPSNKDIFFISRIMNNIY